MWAFPVPVMKQLAMLSEVPAPAAQAQIGKSLLHQGIAQMSNAHFDLRWRHPLLLQMMSLVKHLPENEMLLVA
jgi:hypothetical protein